MAAAVTQAFESIGNNVTQLGKKFKEVTGYDRLSRDQQAFLTGGASEVYDAVDRSNAGATERVQTQNKAQGEAVMKGLEDADAAAKADEAKKSNGSKEKFYSRICIWSSRNYVGRIVIRRRSSLNWI